MISNTNGRERKRLFLSYNAALCCKKASAFKVCRINSSADVTVNSDVMSNKVVFSTYDFHDRARQFD